MYIDPFWCGVAATIIVEVGIIILACFVTGLNHKEDKNNE